MAKKKILYLSDAANANTGFGAVASRLLKSLFLSGKYEILHICQGVPPNDLNLLRFPWKCVAAIPNDQNVINRANADPNFARYMSYGGEMIEPAVLDFKPSVVITVQDPWGGSDFCSQRKFWNQTNCIAWNTLDSIPLHQSCIDQIEFLKNLYCWSSFATEEFHRLGHKHVKTQFPPVDTNIYKPLTKEQKLDLKKYFKIEDKKFIINYVFRSQLRKQSWTLIEGYSLLAKENPEIAKDVWIHFHCSTNEGWNHKRFCEQYGVDYNRILYTWICKNCKELQIKDDNGDKNCPHCNSENTQETCSVQFGATFEQMNWVYNVGDCETILANSGATEIPAIEALSAGLPLATVNYSYGVDFCRQKFVYTLESTKSVEFGTQFIKVMPLASSIKDFILKIYNSTDKEIKEISDLGRKWTIENFDTEKVSKDWQNIIDNLPEITWDFTYKPDIKNPNAQIQNLEKDLDFVIHSYSEILNMKDMTEDKNEVKYWVNFISQPGDKNKHRQDMVNTMRNVALQKNQEQQKTDLADLLDKNDKKRLLLVTPESIGDLIIISSLLESFRESYPKPDWTIYLACKPEYFEIFDLNSNTDKLLAYQPFMDSEIQMTGMGNHKGYFDAFSMITAPSQKFLNYLTNNNLSLELV